jgi:hypothetical protein
VQRLLKLFAAGVGVMALACQGAAQAPRSEAKIIDVQGDVSAQDRSLFHADQMVAMDAGVKIGANASVRVATPCGDIVLVEGPNEGTIGALIGGGTEGIATCPIPVGPEANTRRQLALIFLEQNPTRVLRGARTRSGLWDVDVSRPGATCMIAGNPPMFSGDLQELGDTVEVTDTKTGSQALSYFDRRGGGWFWPEELEAKNGEYRVSSKLDAAIFQVHVLKDPPSDPLALAKAFLASGCVTQGIRILTTLPPDIVVPSKPRQ